MRYLTSLVLLLLVAGCASGGLQITPVAAQQTVAKGTLRGDVLRGLAMTESAWGGGCQNPQVVRIEQVTAPSSEDLASGKLKSGRVKEHWHIDRCGKEVVYEIEYSPDGKGGTYFGMKLIQQ